MKRSVRRILGIALLKTKLLNYINITARKRLGEKKFKIPIIKGIGLVNMSVSEKWMIELIDNLLKIKNGVFIDAGVNLGQSLLKLKSVNPSVRYIGFEPNPACVFYIKQLIEINNFTKTTIIPIGLFNKNDLIEMDFYSTSEVDNAASLIKDFRQSQTIFNKQYVPVFSFDNVTTKLNIT